MNDNSIPFTAPFQVAWRDLDYNRHMANIAYFSYAAQTRQLYFAARGFGLEEFEASGVGPATLDETIHYHREMKFLEHFTVDYLCGGMNSKKTRYVIVNRFRGEDGEIRADISSHFVWMDLKTRRAVAPPSAIGDLMDGLVRTDDFREL
ncbi:thioesterase family protein [Emcibacter sp.]|uniref:acyl-CoA thioesterase n=1 Tax=Emcibacter sp. TaxID=1979954 RepID=UPI002AA86AD1|nr:thioesterase family protein [Emcibacter sp.]